MSAKLTTAAARDDAAFRARLAPLASEVLPRTPKRAPRVYWPVIATAAAAIVLAVCVTWALSRWTWPDKVAVAPVAVPPIPAVAQQPDEMVGLLLRRGDAALSEGDIAAARLLYERAADLGSAGAATSAGKTYDVDFLLRTGARGIQADQTAAAAWFRKAAALGDAEARERLARIVGQPRP
jgi:Sel1 repeat-containing protein